VREHVETHVRQDIAEGVRWLGRNKPVRTLALVIVAFNITWAAPWSVLVLWSLERVGMDEAGFGLLTTAAALGGLLGTAAYGRVESRVPLATLMRTVLACEVVFHLAMALTTSPWAAYPLMFFFGAYAFIWGTLSQAVRQRAVPTEFQGRVGSVYMLCVMGGMLGGSLLGGLIAHQWGVTAPWWFAFVGSGLTLALVWRQLGHIAHADEEATLAVG
jgi:predicted MFS family arabinose efflux permease